MYNRPTMEAQHPHRSTGIVFVISGPSGSGKGSVVRPTMEADSRLSYSVSATTRPPREGDVHGRDYWFVSPEEFEAMVAAGEMLEHAYYAGHRYGTPKEPVEAAVAEGLDILLEIEIQGARQIRAALPEAVLILLLPPSAQELSQRLRSRGTDSEAAITEREAAYDSELAAWPLYDYLVINDDLDRAIEQFRSVIDAERSRVSRLDVQAFLDRNYGGV